ncbi:MAG: 50S ribosomal protein L11 methyltransferase [Firmicutes bacterium]|nr:50S ribosomal protein L11 methyltransferase [Bacillota bacterium]
MKYIEYTVLTTTEASDAVAYILEREGAVGIATIDLNDFLMLNKDKHSWDYSEPTLAASLGTDVKVKGYFYNYSDKIEKSIQGLKNFGLDIGKGQVIINQVNEEDWANAWKKYFKPFKVGKKIVIKPTWEDYKIVENDIIIEIDPGMAFGTGSHETTSMCLELLEKHIKTRDTVIDIGCGSGILGIAAAKLGADVVTCIDFDENACKVAADNVVLNKMENKIKVVKGNLLDGLTVKVDLIISNIIADVIIDLSDKAYRLINSGGLFISSGIIIDRKKDVISQLINDNFKIKEVLEMGEWCAIVGEKE